MAIEMQVPSYVFHAYDVSPKFYRMWRTVEGTPGYKVSDLAASIYGANLAAIHSLNTSLKNIIFNMHGHPGALRPGGLDYTSTVAGDLIPFRILRGSGIGPIWIVSCDVARNSEGRHFCDKFAEHSGCVIIAPNQSQIVKFRDGVKMFMNPLSPLIDSFEGNLTAFYPDGSQVVARDPRSLANTLREGGLHPWEMARPPM